MISSVNMTKSTVLCEFYPQFYADLVTFTEEILNGKLHFLCSENYGKLLMQYFKELSETCNLILVVVTIFSTGILKIVFNTLTLTRIPLPWFKSVFIIVEWFFN